jgi:integrase
MEVLSPAQSAGVETKTPQGKSTRRSKRPRGTGSIFKPHGGKFFYIAYYPVSGSGFQKTESSGSTLKTVAQEMLRDRLEKIRQGLYCETPPRKVTFQTLADGLLDDYRINRRRSIYDAEKRIEKHLRPFFGNYLAAAITTEKAREYLLLRRAAGAADGTVSQEMALLRRMLKLANQTTPPKIPRVPYIQMPRANNVRTGFIEREAYVRLLPALPDYLRPVVTMAYSTGMRRGEICSLRWENVDLLSRQVRLNAGETKNGEGRVIPMSDELLEALTSQLHVRNTTVADCPFVFFRIVKTKGNARWFPIADFRGAWNTACGTAGLTGKIFHDLRRSAVRNLVRAGVQETVAMRISGHKTTSVFQRYNIVSEQDLTDAVRKLQKFQEAAEPACAPAATQPGASPARPAFVN